MSDKPDVSAGCLPARRLTDAMETFRREALRALSEAESDSWRNDAVLMPLGDFVRAHRNVLGLSLEEVAQRAGCTKSHVWEIEAGRARNPTVAMVASLAAALGVSVHALFHSALITAKTAKPVAQQSDAA